MKRESELQRVCGLGELKTYLVDRTEDYKRMEARAGEGA